MDSRPVPETDRALRPHRDRPTPVQLTPLGRRSEMANLDHGDYDSSTRTLLVRKGKNGKNGKSRMLPVGERTGAWLERFFTESRPLFHHLPQETALFLTGYGERFTPAYIGNWIKKLLKRCGIDKPGSCHLWRHSCATDMHRGGADIRYVQEWSGATWTGANATCPKGATGGSIKCWVTSA